MKNIFNILVVLFGLVLAVSCKDANQENNYPEAFLDSTTAQGITVISFLSPDCPLSESYIPVLEKLNAEFSPENCSFLHVFPTIYYGREEIESFIQEFNVSIPFFYDSTAQFAAHLDAKFTPEVFVFNEGVVKYSGAIDNWAISLGKKRISSTEDYLEDALTNLIKGSDPKITKTKTVGCIIEFN